MALQLDTQAVQIVLDGDWEGATAATNAIRVAITADDDANYTIDDVMNLLIDQSQGGGTLAAWNVALDTTAPPDQRRWNIQLAALTAAGGGGFLTSGRIWIQVRCNIVDTENIHKVIFLQPNAANPTGENLDLGLPGGTNTHTQQTCFFDLFGREQTDGFNSEVGRFTGGVQTGSLRIVNYCGVFGQNATTQFFRPFDAYADGESTHINEGLRRHLVELALVKPAGSVTINGPEGFTWEITRRIGPPSDTTPNLPGVFNNFDVDILGAVAGHERGTNGVIRVHVQDSHASANVGMNFTDQTTRDLSFQNEGIGRPAIYTINGITTETEDAITGSTVTVVDNIVNDPTDSTAFELAIGSVTNTNDDTTSNNYILSNVDATLIELRRAGTANTLNPPLRLIRNADETLEIENGAGNNKSYNFVSTAIEIVNADAVNRPLEGWVIRRRNADDGPLLQVCTEAEANTAHTNYANRSRRAFNYDRKWMGRTNRDSETVTLDFIYDYFGGDSDGNALHSAMVSDSDNYQVWAGRCGFVHDSIEVRPRGTTPRREFLRNNPRVISRANDSEITIDSELTTITIRENADITLDDIYEKVACLVQDRVAENEAHTDGSGDSEFDIFCDWMSITLPAIEDTTDDGVMYSYNAFQPWLERGRTLHLPFNLTIPGSATVNPGSIFEGLVLDNDTTLTGTLSSSVQIIDDKAPYVFFNIDNNIMANNPKLSVYRILPDSELVLIARDSDNININNEDDGIVDSDTLIYVFTAEGARTRVGSVDVPSNRGVRNIDIVVQRDANMSLKEDLEGNDSEIVIFEDDTLDDISLLDSEFLVIRWSQLIDDETGTAAVPTNNGRLTNYILNRAARSDDGHLIAARVFHEYGYTSLVLNFSSSKNETQIINTVDRGIKIGPLANVDITTDGIFTFGGGDFDSDVQITNEGNGTFRAHFLVTSAVSVRNIDAVMIREDVARGADGDTNAEDVSVEEVLNSIDPIY